MSKHISMLSAAAAALVIVTAPTAATAQEEFEVFDVFAELNDTDGDLGLHYSLDGGPWTFVALQDPRGHLLWTSKLWGRLWRQGGTEINFESAEPPFESDEDEPTLTPEEFFARFREGEYRATGRSQEGDWLQSTDEFNHVMPAPPEVSVNGEEGAEDCDAEELPAVQVGDVEISWEEVDESHPEIGTPNVEIEVSLYQVVAEIEFEIDGEEVVSKYSVDLSPPPEPDENGMISMTIPEAFVALAEGEEIKYEVLVKEAEGGNQTAVESCFEVEEEE